MAKDKKENFRDLKEGELEKKLVAFREEMRTIKFKNEGAKSKNVKAGGALRKQIARILTVMNAQNK